MRVSERASFHRVGMVVGGARSALGYGKRVARLIDARTPARTPERTPARTPAPMLYLCCVLPVCFGCGYTMGFKRFA